MKYFKKLAKEDWTKYKYEVDAFSPEEEKAIMNRFQRYAKKLDSDEPKPVIGNLERVLIPKKDFTTKQLTKGLGFLPAKIAVPETGQTRSRTYRHPYNNLHVHSHRNYWTMHKDKHPSFTSLKWENILKEKPYLEQFEIKMTGSGKATRKSSSDLVNFIKGMPHNIAEGVPGWFSYLKNKYFNKDRKTTVEKIKDQLKDIKTKQKEKLEKKT